MPSQPELLLRIVVLNPPAGVAFALQLGRNELVPPTSSANGELTFEFSVRVADVHAQPPRLVGPFTQGPPAARFVYVNSGTLAGETSSCWTRRAKVPLKNIPQDAISHAMGNPAVRLETRIRGTAGDGGPACASVPLLTPWAPAKK
ncbi:MAG TPA: DUF5990 family protein [Luteimonas sp.]|nr:DUF5990 family protein [Luteimonas sp.]